MQGVAKQKVGAADPLDVHSGQTFIWSASTCTYHHTKFQLTGSVSFADMEGVP